MTCRRILIINKGKIVASDSPESLQKRLEGDVLISAEIAGDPSVIEATLKSLGTVDVVSHDPLDNGWNRYRIDSSAPSIRTQVFECAVSNGWKLRELHLESRSLEDIFVAIIRDDVTAGTLHSGGASWRRCSCRRSPM